MNPIIAMGNTGKLLVEQFAASVDRSWAFRNSHASGEYGLYARGAEFQSDKLRWQQQLAEGLAHSRLLSKSAALIKD